MIVCTLCDNFKQMPAAAEVANSQTQRLLILYHTILLNYKQLLHVKEAIEELVGLYVHCNLKAVI